MGWNMPPRESGQQREVSLFSSSSQSRTHTRELSSPYHPLSLREALTVITHALFLLAFLANFLVRSPNKKHDSGLIKKSNKGSVIMTRA
jgi:hypothetical protein